MTTTLLTHTEVFSFIKAYSAKHGYSPSIREIARAIGTTSTSVASAYLDELTKKGFISRAERIARGIVVLRS